MQHRNIELFFLRGVSKGDSPDMHCINQHHRMHLSLVTILFECERDAAPISEPPLIRALLPCIRLPRMASGSSAIPAFLESR